MNILEGYFYTKNHEWVLVEGNEAVIGISDYAQEAMGDIVYVELPEVDDTIDREDSFGVVESVKAAADVYMPIDGTVVAVNESLEDEPELINGNAYENWIMRVKINDDTQLEDLMNSEQYKEFCETEE